MKKYEFENIENETIEILSKYYDIEEIYSDLKDLDQDCYSSYPEDFNELIQSDLSLVIHSLDEILGWIYSDKVDYAYNLKTLGKSQFYYENDLNYYRTFTGETLNNYIDFEKYGKDILKNCYYTYFEAKNGSLILIIE